MKEPLSVLFLCTENSARSQIAEAMLRQFTHGQADVHSAGADPAAEIHPVAIDTLRTKFHLEMTGQFPKSLDRCIDREFDYVITLCDRAVETCPTLPGDPQRIHWGFPDPTAVQDVEEQRRAFERVITEIGSRLRIFLALGVVREKLDAQ